MYLRNVLNLMPKRKNDAVFCNYYGQLDGELLGDNIGIYCVDEAYQRILEKHENHLIKTQENLIKNLRKSFSEDIKSFKFALSNIDERLNKLEQFYDLIKDKK